MGISDMRLLGKKNHLLQNGSYENLDSFSNVYFDLFKELSVVISSVHFILPNVADCKFKDDLHRFY